MKAVYIERDKIIWIFMDISFQTEVTKGAELPWRESVTEGAFRLLDK